MLRRRASGCYGILYIMLAGMVVLVFAELAASGATYYINGAIGDNANNGLSPIPGGARFGPWKSLDAGSNSSTGVIAPGDTIEIAAGTYIAPSSGFVFSKGGSESNPVHYHCNGRVLVDGGYGCDSVILLQINCNYVVWDGFEVTHGRVNGFEASGSIGNVFKNCVVHDIGLAGQVESYGLKIRYSNGTKFLNNVVYNINPASFSSALVVEGWPGHSGGTVTCVYNNTFYKTGNTVVWHNADATCEFKNNIVSNVGTYNSNYGWDVVDDYNLWYQAADPPINNGKYDGHHDITGQDPLFVSLDTANFHLTAGSPAINAGTDLGQSYPKVDSVYDIGAFEYGYVGIQGKVLQNTTGFPSVAGAKVELVDASVPTETYSGTDGSYILLVPSGTRTFRITRLGCLTVQEDVTVVPDTMTDHDFLLNLPAPTTIDRLSELKTQSALPVRVYVSVRKTAMAESGPLPGEYYIEETDRSFGVRVVPNVGLTEVHEGNGVTLTGTLNKDENGELCIYADTMNGVWSGSKLTPLAMANKAIPAASKGAMGLLVKVWGTVTYIASDNSFFYIDDGSGVDDGSGYAKGVRVIPKWEDCPEIGSFVTVTGFAGLSRLESVIVPVIRPLNKHRLTPNIPVVLHNSICGQWGGHTFGYLLEGPTALFWSAKVYVPSQSTQVTCVIGQYPKPGSNVPVATTTWSYPGVYGVNVPQMVRTPDGYIHIFSPYSVVGSNGINPGYLTYKRSTSPDDIRSFEDRTQNIPTTPYNEFHLRLNVGISPDGTKIALVILALSQDFSVPFNTPVIFRGTYSPTTHDFSFANPVAYAEPMSLFYPQVCVENNGEVIIVGEIWDDSTYLCSRLIHLDANNNVLHREDIPMSVPGSRFCHDMRPNNGTDWSHLALYVDTAPIAHDGRFAHEFWIYDVPARKLTMRRSVSSTYGTANAGKLIQMPYGGGYFFVNNPSSSQFYLWDGDLFGTSGVTSAPIAGCSPVALGYLGCYYVFAPNPIYGSVLPANGDFYVATDAIDPGRVPTEPGPFTFLMWRIHSDGTIDRLRFE